MPTNTINSIQSRGVKAGSIWTSYVEAGPADGDPVVLLHDGAPGTTANLCWDPIIQELSRDYRVIAPEMLGFGGTDKVAFFDRSPYAARIEHLAEFFRALRLEASPFIGASLGGSIILRALAQHPGALPVSKAMSLSGPGGPFRKMEAFAKLAEYVPTLESTREAVELMVDSVDGLEDHIQSRLESALEPGHWEAQNAGTLRNPVQATPSAPIEDTYIEDLATIDVEVFLVEGRHDKMIEGGWSEEIARHIPKAQSVIYDFSHEPNIDQPSALIPVIREFLSK